MLDAEGEGVVECAGFARPCGVIGDEDFYIRVAQWLRNRAGFLMRR